VAMASTAVALQQENQVLRARLEQKELRIHQLEALVQQFKHREFGPSS